MQDRYKPEELLISKDIARALTVITGLITPNSLVTVEGTPLYAGEPWSQAHEFGLNTLVPAVFPLLDERSCQGVHYAMIDDFTTGQYEDGERFSLQMRLPPTSVSYESQFAESAEEAFRYLQASGKTLYRGNEALLRSGSMPRLRVRSGRVSCELLDACFQRQKEGDIHIIFHPTEFVNQQQGMRDVLMTINGGTLPAIFINAFFKGNSINRILAINHYGRTERLYY